MEVSDLKNYIYEENKIEDILIDLGLHHIVNHSNYYTCGNVDGDNPIAITVYNNENLFTINYTRNMNNGNYCDLITLVEFVKEMDFFTAKRYIAELIGLDIYSDLQADIPLGLQFINQLKEMSTECLSEPVRECLNPIDEGILQYYGNYVNDMFLKDNIDYFTQTEFELGYDDYSNRITIPIRDEYGTLVGVKGRLFKEQLEENENKYMYLEPCSKSQILFGIYKTLPYIKKNKFVYICESEKAVMQLWSYGICNAVALGGHKISRTQLEKLIRLNVDIVLCFDKDIGLEDIKVECNKFIDLLDIKIYYLLDSDNILDEKESPTDNYDKFKHLIENNKYYYAKAKEEN